MFVAVSSAMFDWNDEEITNIIWGESGESDDHIVPYPEGSKERPPCLYGDHIKKERNREATDAKPPEQKTPIAKTEYTGGKKESSLHYDTTVGISAAGNSMDPWPDLSVSHAAKTDQDSMETEVPDNLTEITKFDSSMGGVTSQLDNSSEIFQNHYEEREQSDFVDYGWASIRSFDDLDRIFSNNDPIYGHASLGKADDLWSSSKDATSSPEKSYSLSMESPSLGLRTLRSTSGTFEVKTENVHDQDQCFTHGYAKMSYLTSHTRQNVHASADQVDYAGGESMPVAKEKSGVELLGKRLVLNSHLAAENFTTLNQLADKVKNQKRILKSRKKLEEECAGQQVQDSCSTWSPCGNQFQQFDGQIAPSMPQTCTSSVLFQQTQLQGPASSQYQHSPNPFVAPSVCGSIKNQYSTMIGLPQFHSTEHNQAVLSGYEISPSIANPLRRSPGTSMKPLTMTPQEKVEKLRRRQQIRALLAIKKQQQQFSRPVSSNDNSVAEKCLHESQIQMVRGGNLEVEEDVRALPFVDPNSPIEQDDYNKISMAIDDYDSVEDTILHRLQDIITKLDIRIRLCIRDSLFRLAQSAMLRHYASETSSINKNSGDELEFLTKEETSSHNRFTRLPNVETETNPIDRTVAHLLFHRPLELSAKHPETPESPASNKLLCKRNTAGLLGSPRGFLPDNSKMKENMSYHRSKNPHFFAEGDSSKNSPCIDTTENASNSEAADGGFMDIEASQ